MKTGGIDEPLSCLAKPRLQACRETTFQKPFLLRRLDQGYQGARPLDATLARCLRKEVKKM